MSSENELSALGPWIREMRERRTWSLQELADRSGLSKPYLAQLERGEANPTESTLKKVAAAFDMRLMDLLNAALGDPSQDVDSPAFRDFLQQYHPEPELLPALRQLQFRGRPPATASDWRKLYEVIRTLTSDDQSAT